MLATVIFCLGAAMSLAASALLVTRLVRIGELLGLSEAMLGLLAALAADAPEVSAAVSALSHGQRDVGVGVILGSNVFNLAALLGLGAVVAGRIALHRRVVVLEGIVALWIAAVAVAVVAGWIVPATGCVLAAAVFGPYVLISAIHPRRRRRWLQRTRWRKWLDRTMIEEEEELLPALHPPRGHPADGILAAAALTVVVVASMAMERAATSLGERYGVPNVVVGGVVLAAVTSLPNAVAAVYLASRGRGAAMLSEAANSNTLNIIVGLLLPTVVLGLNAPSHGALFVAAWYGGMTLFVLSLAFRSRALSRRSGVAVIGLYGVFVALLVAVGSSW